MTVERTISTPIKEASKNLMLGARVGGGLVKIVAESETAKGVQDMIRVRRTLARWKEGEWRAKHQRARQIRMNRVSYARYGKGERAKAA